MLLYTNAFLYNSIFYAKIYLKIYKNYNFDILVSLLNTEFSIEIVGYLADQRMKPRNIRRKSRVIRLRTVISSSCCFVLVPYFRILLTLLCSTPLINKIIQKINLFIIKFVI